MAKRFAGSELVFSTTHASVFPSLAVLYDWVQGSRLDTVGCRPRWFYTFYLLNIVTLCDMMIQSRLAFGTVKRMTKMTSTLWQLEDLQRASFLYLQRLALEVCQALHPSRAGSKEVGVLGPQP